MWSAAARLRAAQSREREHLLLGFQKALQNLDAVIALIRAAGSPREGARRSHRPLRIYGEAGSGDHRAAITALDRHGAAEIIDELAEIQRRITEYLEILGSEKVLKDLIVKELRESRRTTATSAARKIIEDTGEIKLEDLWRGRRGRHHHRGIPQAHQRGYLRRQSRGGKGRIGMGTRTEDSSSTAGGFHAQLHADLHQPRTRVLVNLRNPRRLHHRQGQEYQHLINLQPDETAKAFLAVHEFRAR